MIYNMMGEFSNFLSAADERGGVILARTHTVPGNNFENVRSRRVLGADRKYVAPSDLPEELALSGYLIFELSNFDLEPNDPRIVIKNASTQSTAFQPGEIVLITSSGSDVTNAS